MERFKNHYRALNIPSTADATTIKAAFRGLALRYHPDRARSTRTTRRFKEIREAYEILSDPETRRQYDEIYRAHTALRPVISDVEGPEVNARARTGSAGIGITVDLLGLKLGLAVDASASRRAARLPKPPPRKGPPRKGPRPR
jgi:curved DNA-binding protein CbpA